MSSIGLCAARRATLPHVHTLVLAVAILLISALTGCTRAEPDRTTVRYVTEYGLGPDKWAAAWLLARHADPNAELVVVEPGTPLGEGVTFDLPSAELRRIGNHSTFDAVRTKFEVRDPTVAALAAIVHEIEINFWAAGGPPEAILVEEAFRALQYRHGRDAVTPKCYVAFFDRVYQVVQEAQSKAIPISAERLQLGCEDLLHLADQGRDLIPEVPLVDVLSAAAAGRKVVYVDVREADEFAESHIPGALNIPIRDVSSALREQLSGADYVVSYCVKDFRGYEMAKALAQVGVKNSVIMRPYGIKGWVAMGLPVTGEKALSESQGRQLLDQCLADTQACLAGAVSST